MKPNFSDISSNSKPILPVTALQSHINLIQASFTQVETLNLKKIISLTDQFGSAPLEKILSELYPSHKNPQRSLNYLVNKFNKTSATFHGHTKFKVELENNDKTRVLTFSATALAEDAELAEYLATEAGDTTILASQPAIKIEKEPLIRYHVCTAEIDKNIARKLISEVDSHLNSIPGYRFQKYESLVGEQRLEPNAILAKPNIVLALLSPTFFAEAASGNVLFSHCLSSDIDAHVIPVYLKTVLEPWRCERKMYCDDDGQAFLDLNNDRKKRQFALALAQQVVDYTNRHIRRSDGQQAAMPLERLLAAQVIDESESKLATAKGQRTHFNTLQLRNELKPVSALEQNSENAIDFLTAWFDNPNAPIYCALLGELGMGKTTTSKALARTLLARRTENPASPLAFYLDLRSVNGQEKKASQMTVEEIVQTILQRSWKTAIKPLIDATEVIRRVREDGALVIFDGLDEVLVSLTDAEGQQLTRQLFAMLPLPRSQHKKPGRMLLTCRNHYFRTVDDEARHFTAEGRDNISDEHYRAFLLLPFDHSQILEYFRNTFPDEPNPQRLVDLVGSVHNLLELGQRPFLLSLIKDQLSIIEQWKAERQLINSAALYGYAVNTWLKRDFGKHQIPEQYKTGLMEYLAAALHQAGQRSWRVSQLEDWFVAYLESNPHVRNESRTSDWERLKEDFRTATFLVREGDESFRFAHSSLQEFFLAQYLFRALIEGRIIDWKMGPVSRETLNFLGQLLQKIKESNAIEDSRDFKEAESTMMNIRKEYVVNASEMLLTYSLHAIKYGYPSISLVGICLTEANLTNVTLEAPRPKSGEPPFSLKKASFRNAKISNTTFNNLSLENCIFDGADLSRTNFLKCRLRSATFLNSKLEGGVFRECNLSGSDFNDARLFSTRILNCEIRKTKHLRDNPPYIFLAGCTATGEDTLIDFSTAPRNIVKVLVDGVMKNENTEDSKPPLNVKLNFFSGHSLQARSVRFSKDGRYLLTASSDSTLRLWDIASGDCVAIYKGHRGMAYKAIFSPDEGSIASCSYDGTVRIWDTSTTQCLMVLQGHSNGVTDIEFTPDGKSLISVSGNEVGIWDVEERKTIAGFYGAEGIIKSIAISPDGHTLALGSKDKFIHFWDMESRELISKIANHDCSVSCIAFSPNGDMLASASEDLSIRLWDISTSECTALLHGHESYINDLVFTPDGNKLLSCGTDGEVWNWDVDQSEGKIFTKNLFEECQSLDISYDGSKIVYGGFILTVCDYISSDPICVILPDTHRIGATAMAPNELAVAGGLSDNSVVLIERFSGEPLGFFAAQSSRINHLTFSPDGRLLVSGLQDSSIQIWNASDSTCVQQLQVPMNGVHCVVFSSDGASLACGGGDGSIHIWSTLGFSYVCKLEGHRSTVKSISFSPCGKYIISGSEDKTIRIWETLNQKCISILKAHRGTVGTLTFSPDGTMFASGSHDRTVRIWNINTKSSRKLGSHDDWIQSVCFSSDGSRLLSSSDDTTLKIWDVLTKKCLNTFEGHNSWVRAAFFTEEGSQVFSIAIDGSLRTWEAETAIELRQNWRFFSGWVTIDVQNNTIIAGKGDFWRYLGWRLRDETSGDILRFPVERYIPSFLDS